MQWWNNFVEWLYSEDGWRVLSSVVFPSLAIVVAGFIAAMIGRGATRRLLVHHDRERRTATVSAMTFLTPGIAFGAKMNPAIRAGVIGDGGAAATAGNFKDMTIWFKTPARDRNETLPLGNGRLGALVYGDPKAEKLQLTEETLWAGGPTSRNKIGAYKKFPEMIKAMKEGRFDETDSLVSKHVLSPQIRLRQEMLGELHLTFADADKVTDYRRELSFDSAVAVVSYQSSGATFTRKTFVSAVDQTLVMIITCDKPGRLTFDAKFKRTLEEPAKKEKNKKTADTYFNSRSGVLPGSDDTLILQGTGDPVETGLKFESRLKIVHEGVKVVPKGNTIHVEAADRVVLLLAAATNFKKGTVNGPDPAVVCAQQLAEAVKRNPETMMAEHSAEHQSFFRRASLELGRSTEEQRALPTNERVKRIKKTNERDPDIDEQLFQMGRYLLISSSRPGTQAATLHGI